MLYLATSSTPDVRAAMARGALGLLNTPDTSYDLAGFPGVTWAADNGCFAAQWDPAVWLAWLERQPRARCLFAVVPDVVADAAATLERWHEWAPIAGALDYPLAFVLQDGAMSSTVPWDELEVLFVGGSTEYKLSAGAAALAAEARSRGKRTHMGRVNSLRRLRLAAREGYDTVDGTYLAFGPDINLPKLLRFLRMAAEPTLL